MYSNIVFNMYGGTITGHTASGYSSGGGVSTSYNCTFNMYGGKITKNHATMGGGVGVSGRFKTPGEEGYVPGATFNMYGGEISENEVDANYNGGGVYVGTGATFNMSGDAKIYKNKGGYNDGVGGGVYVNGAFNMTGGTIGGATTEEANTAANGGGVFVAQEATFTMSGGTISGNTTANLGGGVCTCGTFEMKSENGSNPTIDNNSGGSGGGVFVTGTGNTLGTFTMSGGTIRKNYASRDHGGGVYFNRGTFNLMGGTISENQVETNGDIGGGIYVNGSQTINVSGSPVVRDNTKKNTKAADNVALISYEGSAASQNAKINVVGNLGETAYIEINYPSNNVENQITAAEGVAYQLQDGYILVKGVLCEHTSERTHHDAVPATCTQTGTKEYWECTCGKKFDAATGGNVIANVVTEKKQHNFEGGSWIQIDENYHAKKCADCSATDTQQPHNAAVGAQPTEDTPVRCEDCGYIMQSALGHQCKAHLTPVAEKASTCTV